MGMLDRYRKAGGFYQLLNLIETSPEAKQEKFLSLIKEESAAWEAEIRKRKLTFDQIASWQQSHLMEVCPRIPEKIIAVALYPLPPEKREGFLKSLSHAGKRAVDEFLSGNPPSAGEIFSCQSKIVQEVRTMGQQGHIKLAEIDPDLAIPESIEEKLNNSIGPLTIAKATAPTSSSAAASSPTSATKSTATPSAAPAPASNGISGAHMEELVELRRRIQNLQHSHEQLEKENKILKEKLEQIRKIA